MKVKLLTSLSTIKGSWIAGDIVELKDSDAKNLISKKLAEKVKTTTQKAAGGAKNSKQS